MGRGRSGGLGAKRSGFGLIERSARPLAGLGGMIGIVGFSATRDGLGDDGRSGGGRHGGRGGKMAEFESGYFVFKQLGP